MATKTASFTMPGVLPPYAQDMALAAEEQQRLAEALAAVRRPGGAQPIQAGRLSALNFEGVGNALQEALLEKKQAAARKKSADTQGAYQAELLRGLKAYTEDRDGATKELPGPPEPGQSAVTGTQPANPLAFRSGELSPFPEVRNLAGEDRKSYETLFGRLLEKASPKSALGAGGDARLLRPKVEQKEINGAVMAMGQEAGEAPTVLPGMGVTQDRLPNGSTVNVLPGGKLDMVDKAPKVNVTNNQPGQKGDIKLLETVGGNLANRAEELSKATPGQFRALADAENASRSGAFQGPVAGWVQGAAGILRQFGVAPDEAQRLLKNSETLNSDMGRFVLAALKATGTNPSNADREYADRTAGGQKLSPEGLQAVIRASRVDILNNILEHNKAVDRAKPSLGTADLVRLPLPQGKMDLSGYALNEDGLYMPTGTTHPPKAGGRLTEAQKQRLRAAGITPSED